MSLKIDALLSARDSGDGEGDPGGKKAYTVGQYNRGVERRVKEIPATWVKGVVTQLQVRGKVAYLTIGEFEEGDARPRAVLDAIIWSWQLDDYNARFALLPTPFSLRPELKVSLLLEASFYAPTGRFQPRVLDVDESFTLGELSLTRQKILETLRKEGLIERNKRLALAPVPLRIGLISSRGSAAYQDFTTVLLQSGFSFRILFAEARMQGPATEDTVAAALTALARRDLDVICLVRGGGSKTDLVFFDSEKICRAIALCPVPVLTGIGHEIDRSLADVVAYADLLTPTDCAKFLEGRAEDALSQLSRHASTLREAWQLGYQEQGYAAIQKAEWLRTVWHSRAQRETMLQAESAKNLIDATLRNIKGSHDKLKLNRIGLLRGPAKLSRLERLRFLNRTGLLRRGWELFRLGRENALATVRARLSGGASALLNRNAETLGFKRQLIQASDPAVLLGRGFAQVVSPSGQWVRGARDLAVGDEIRVRFADGSVGARIQEKNQENP